MFVKRNIIKFSCAGLIFSGFLGLTSLNANAEFSDGAAIKDDNYTKNKAYYEKLEKAKDKEMEAEEKAYQIKQSKQMKKHGVTKVANEYYTIPVNYIKQQYKNYCGVAAGVEALSFHKNKSKSSEKLPSQNSFGTTIGILPNKGATASTYLADGLNKYKYVFKFSSNPYVVGNIAQYANPKGKLVMRIKSTLRTKKIAPIVLTETRFISQYKQTNYRHYVTVSGYNGGKSEVRLVDPNHHTEFTKGKPYWTSLGGTSKNSKGLAKAVYTADQTSSNPVMVW